VVVVVVPWWCRGGGGGGVVVLGICYTVVWRVVPRLGAFAAHCGLLLCHGVGHLLPTVACCCAMVWGVCCPWCGMLLCHGVGRLLPMVWHAAVP